MIFNVITWDFNPEIFTIGNYGPRWYGLMFALAFFTGYLIFKRFLRADKLTAEMLDALLIYRKKNKEVRDGFIFGVSIIALFSARFLIEFVKNDQVAFVAGMSLNMGQLLSLPFIFAGIGMIIWTKLKPRYFSQEPLPQVSVKEKMKKT
jgi:prolipoprotein diacylglyceryltransferase